MAVSNKNLKSIVEATIGEVTSDLLEKHPRLKGKEDYLLKYLLNIKAVYSAAQQTIQNLTPAQKKGYSPEQVAYSLVSALQQNPQKYLTEQGKATILREYAGLEKEVLKSVPKTGFRKFDALIRLIRGKEKGRIQEYTRSLDKTVDTAINEFAEVSYIAQKYNGTITPRVKEILYDASVLGFGYEFIDVLQHNKSISANEANKWRNLVSSSYKKARVIMKEEVKKTLEETTQKYASATAAVFFLTGFLLLGFSSSNMTGFAVGSKPVSVNSTIVAGFVCLIAALILSYIPRRHHAPAVQSLQKKRSKQ